MKKLSSIFIFCLVGIFTACSANRTVSPTPLQTSSLSKTTATLVEQVRPSAALPLPTTLEPEPTHPATPQTENTPVDENPALLDAAPTTMPTPVPTLGPDDWQKLPVIPQISPNAVEIYRHGVALGNDPQAFSKIGDCGSTPAWFLGDFDRDPQYYRLGDYQELATVINVFQGSFSRTSLAAKSGFNASSIFSSLWSDHEQCQRNEAPLDCEYRVNRPSIAFIMLGSNDVFHPDDFEPQMRKIIETSIAQGVLPILSTKADNAEGDGRINATIARLAQEYDIPLWNYWRAVQDLPDQGLQEDKVHITWAPNRFDDPFAMSRGWPVRNLNALQILDSIWKAVNS